MPSERARSVLMMMGVRVSKQIELTRDPRRDAMLT